MIYSENDELLNSDSSEKKQEQNISSSEKSKTKQETEKVVQDDTDMMSDPGEELVSAEEKLESEEKDEAEVVIDLPDSTLETTSLEENDVTEKADDLSDSPVENGADENQEEAETDIEGSESNSEAQDNKQERLSTEETEVDSGSVEKETGDAANDIPGSSQENTEEEENDETDDVDIESHEDEPSENMTQEEEEEEEERVNYELLSKEDLVKLLDDILSNKPFEKLKNSVEEIRSIYYEKHKAEIADKKEKFLADGGQEQDFKPVEDPSEVKLSELFEKYKSLKAEYSKQLEEVKETNLAVKEELLEEFRLLMEGQDGFDNTFRKFKQLQKRWFDVGVVPQSRVKDLWNSYNYFVEKFNDYVKINRELRALDLKKNYELKEKLCEKAEELLNDQNIVSAFKTLQKYHAQWRDIGPVPREEKDTLWERFKSTTSQINKLHQQYQSELKDSLVKNLELKEELCKKAEAMLELENHNHNDWVNRTNELLGIQEEWKTIGYAPKKDNNQIYARFRRACDAFFDKKAEFYAETYEQQKKNIKKKEEIVIQAEDLKDSVDWKNTTDKLIDLQRKWKDIGPVPRKESDKLWKRFRAACDHFFNNKSHHFSGMESSFEDNLKEKEDLINEMRDYQAEGTTETILEKLNTFQSRYNDIGFVPVEVKDKIRNDFREQYNRIIDSLDVDDSEKSLIRFKNRIAGILSNPKAENKLRFEREKLISKLQQLRNDIGVWENNIGFFKETKSSEATLNEFQDKIEDARIRIDLLERKIRIIDDMEDEG